MSDRCRPNVWLNSGKTFKTVSMQTFVNEAKEHLSNLLLITNLDAKEKKLAFIKLLLESCPLIKDVVVRECEKSTTAKRKLCQSLLSNGFLSSFNISSLGLHYCCLEKSNFEDIAKIRSLRRLQIFSCCSPEGLINYEQLHLLNDLQDLFVSDTEIVWKGIEKIRNKRNPTLFVSLSKLLAHNTLKSLRLSHSVIRKDDIELLCQSIGNCRSLGRLEFLCEVEDLETNEQLMLSLGSSLIQRGLPISVEVPGSLESVKMLMSLLKENLLVELSFFSVNLNFDRELLENFSKYACQSTKIRSIGILDSKFQITPIRSQTSLSNLEFCTFSNVNVDLLTLLKQFPKMKELKIIRFYYDMGNTEDFDFFKGVDSSFPLKKLDIDEIVTSSHRMYVGNFPIYHFLKSYRMAIRRGLFLRSMRVGTLRSPENTLTFFFDDGVNVRKNSVTEPVNEENGAWLGSTHNNRYNSDIVARNIFMHRTAREATLVLMSVLKSFSHFRNLSVMIGKFLYDTRFCIESWSSSFSKEKHKNQKKKRKLYV